MQPRTASHRAQSATATPLHQFLKHYWATLSCSLILLLMGVAMVQSLPYHTVTTDETVHIPAGYINWQQHDFAPNNEHPPLAKLWATLPWLALDPPIPPTAPADTPAKRTINAGRYFWQLNAPQMAQLLFWARVPMIAITLLLGALIFICGKHFFSPRAGLLAVTLFALEPTVLGHGWIVHTDIPATTAYLGWWAMLATYAARPTWRRALALGIVSGLAITTKYNLLVVIPIGVLALLILWLLAPRGGHARRPLLGHATMITAISLLILNAVYFFTWQPLGEIDLNWLWEEAPDRAELISTIIHYLTPIIPPYYQFGTYTVLIHNAEGHSAGLLGNFSQQGWWYYFPVAFALKTTVPFLLLTIAGLGWACWRLVIRREYRLLWLLGPLLLFTASTMSSHINIGVRHFLPVYPFCFLLAGNLLDQLLGRWASLRAGPARLRIVGTAFLTALLLGWHLLAALRSYPDHLSYFNELARPQPHWYYLSDSNIEWGQAIGELADYLHAHGETRVRAAVATPETLGYLGITLENLLKPETITTPPTRYIAIGGSFLNGSVIDATQPDGDPDLFAAYRYQRPVAIFGGSISLYDATLLPNPPPLTAPLPDQAFRATIVVRNPPTQMRVGQEWKLRLHVTNTSPIPFPKDSTTTAQYQVRVGNRWLAPNTGAAVADDGRESLAFPIMPGQTADLTLIIIAPKQPGNYLLSVDLLQEHVDWFGERGGTPQQIPIRILP